MGSRTPRSDNADAHGESTPTIEALVEEAQRLIDRLQHDRSAHAEQLALEAGLFVKVFARWQHHPPTDGQRDAAAGAFLSLQHRAADYISRHVTPETLTAAEPDLGSPSDAPAAPDERDLAARAAVERLVRDLSLRGGLDRASFEGLVGWATDRALAIAASLGEEVDPQRAPSMVLSLMTWLVRAAVDAAESGDVGGLVAAVWACPESVIERDLASKLLKRLALGNDAAANAAAIGEALRAATPLDPL